MKTKMNVKKTKKRNKRSYKTHYLVGGSDGIGDPNNTDLNTREIMNKIKSEREFNLGNSEIVKKSINLLKGLFVTATERIAKLANVNIDDSSDINTKLDEIKQALINPENKEKLREIVSQLAENGTIIIQAGSPFFKEFMEKAVNIGTKTLSEIGESIVKIGLNVSEEIPGLGILIGTIRSLSNAGEAFVASTNAMSEIITASSDAINAATMNYKKIMDEKKQSMNRIQNSMNSFTQPMTNAMTNMNQIPPITSKTMPGYKPIVGGFGAKKKKTLKRHTRSSYK